MKDFFVTVVGTVAGAGIAFQGFVRTIAWGLFNRKRLSCKSGDYVWLVIRLKYMECLSVLYDGPMSDDEYGNAIAELVEEILKVIDSDK